MSRASIVAAVVMAAIPARAMAQNVPAGRVEVSAGVIAMGSISLGSADATETTPTGSTSTLFKTSTVLERVSGLNVRVGVRAWRRIEAEAFASITKPRLATTISNDVESGDTVTASEPIEQYVVGGGALWYLPVRVGTRLAPFVGGGIAYLRQLHESNTVAVTGRVYEVGGGAKYFFLSRPSGRLNGLGVRADARIAARSRGVAFDSDIRYGPTLSASLFVRF